MRVITGTARGVPLKAPKGMDTRPNQQLVVGENDANSVIHGRTS